MTDRQRGVALISVLLITALVTLIVSDMLARQRLNLISSANQSARQQLWQLALSGEAWARQQLLADLRDQQGLARVHLGQRWAQGPQEFEIEGGRIRIHLEDLGARFNLDRLRDGRDRFSHARYQRLLALLGLAPHDPARLSAPLGRDGKPLPFADASELWRLAALDAAGMRRLRPWVAATRDGGLNLNTAPAEQLASLEGLDMGIAQALVQARPADGYSSVQAFIEQPLLAGRKVEQYGLSVASERFRAVLDVALGEHRLRLVSDLLTRSDGQVQILRRRLAAPDLPFSE
ncbi:TPA: type II secretion system minor pseudopilin GspK [Pseudomonas aeruginosa]|uniref:type II secretion system minor pseudopilin GspK n=2 Tax=Pseudomonas aeruginosa TaxID=287 RepID=UPI000EAFBC03|nr:type II secretion system minor pseudopilin GspK [Pseudomonas aeruginosa]EKV4568255.1 type II secretion system minor pseudopilin GspK [Pseudomonas aeruginosa]MBU8389662.1 type II secretion system minor pseudopilin GspK [Pseudomonas aeruginosa]MBY1010569.1 type II secretion system minor pseudopilin GspK [Pseudomonas aeruginosa]MCV4185956.1 type II secretion system minor pseudopilin GspK [Pseudomonas aeruginosa]MCV4358621.1 type II secretion system minor pseudopilin GspK [Pseudomonas aeruginos